MPANYFRGANWRATRPKDFGFTPMTMKINLMEGISLPTNPPLAGLRPDVATTDHIVSAKISLVMLPLKAPISDAKC